MLVLLSVLTSAVAIMAVPLIAESRGALPDPGEVYIKSASYGGTGCPGGSVGFTNSSDATSFTVQFDKFVASTSSIENWRKACTVSLDLHIPTGFQYTISYFNVRGNVYLDPDVTAIQRNTYYFSGYSAQVSGQTNFTGFVDEDFVASDKIGAGSFVYSPCGTSAILNINSQVSLMKPKNCTGRGTIQEDSLDGFFSLQFQLGYQKCPTT